MTLEDLQRQLTEAFDPNRCYFKFIDFRHRFQFEVRSPENEVLHQESDLLVADFMDDDALRHLIEHVRCLIGNA